MSSELGIWKIGKLEIHMERHGQDRFEDDWRFFLGEVKGGERPGLDDSKWRRLDLPHDWSIEDLPPKPPRRLGRILDLTGNLWRTRAGDDPRWKLPGSPILSSSPAGGGLSAGTSSPEIEMKRSRRLGALS